MMIRLTQCYMTFNQHMLIILWGTNTTNTVPQVATPSSASTSEAPPPTPAAPHSFSNILQNKNQTPAATSCPKSYLDEALERAKASVKKIPQKHFFEDCIIELQE